MKLLYLSCLLFALSLVQATYAQSYYNFTKKNAPYSHLSGATVLTSDLSQQNYVFTIPAGFKMFGKNLSTTLQVGRNGYVVCTGPTNSFAFDPYLQGLSVRPSGSAISAKVDVAGTDTIIKIEWRNVTVTGSPATDSLNFQAWLYKKNQTIEFHYGPCNNSATFDTAVINTSLLSTDFMTNYESHSIVGTPAIPYDDSDPNTPNFFIGTIANGTVYSFTNSTTGISAIHTEKPVLYPNPAGNTLFIDAGTAELVSYSIYNAVGTTVVTGTAYGRTAIDVSSLSKGIYTVRVGNENLKFIHK